MEVDETCNVHDPAAGEDWQQYFDFDRWVQDYPSSGTETAEISHPNASDTPSEHTLVTTLEDSDVTSNAPSYDPGPDDMMQESGNGDMNGITPEGGFQPSGRNSNPLLIPVLSDKHKERTVVDRPQTLPPARDLVIPVGPVTPVHLRGPRPLAPAPPVDDQAITSWTHGSPPQLETPQRIPRTRALKDPKQTAEVRAKGSCQHCSLLRVKVST